MKDKVSLFYSLCRKLLGVWMHHFRNVSGWWTPLTNFFLNSHALSLSPCSSKARNSTPEFLLRTWQWMWCIWLNKTFSELDKSVLKHQGNSMSKMIELLFNRGLTGCYNNQKELVLPGSCCYCYCVLLSAWKGWGCEPESVLRQEEHSFY